MLFPTLEFALFFAVVLVAYWVARPWPLAWRLVLLSASYYFYGAWDPRFCLLLAASTVANWFFGELASRAQVIGARRPAMRWVIAATVAANLGILGWFKYYGFFATEVRNGLDDIGLGLPLPLVQVALPVGISFFTFQGISYVMDLARGELRKPMHLLDFAVFQSFFAHLVAGPIVRASELGPQLARPLQPAQIDRTAAMLLILGGLFKKVVISSYVASEIVDPVYAVPGDHSRAEILLAMYGYAIQIYADFSGYTDIAIGCALLLGFRFPQNFDAPYSALSLQEFWRRWHMTLSRWLRDYLYVAVGGNRGSRLFTARNLMITMVLGGLWHGAAWTFVLWGAVHGLGLALERFIPSFRPSANPSRAVTVLRWLLTFHIVCFAWVLFRAQSVGLAADMFTGLVNGGPGHGLVTPMLLAVIAGAIGVQLLPRRYDLKLREAFGGLSLAPQVACLAGAIVAVDALGPDGVAPFIYFQV